MSQALGSFSCDATTSTGNFPYYQLLSNGRETAFQPLECEALSASSTEPYYAVRGGVPDAPQPIHESPASAPFSDPELDLTNSKASRVGRDGESSIISAGTAGYGISAVQYAKDSSYFFGNADTPPVVRPTGPPGLPSLAAPPTEDTIPIIFDTAGIGGTQPLIYTLLYGTTPMPGGDWTTLPTLPVIGSTRRVANATGLEKGTLYYFGSRVRNTAGGVTSQIVSFSTAGDPVAPNKSPTVPTFVSATNSSITVQFDVSGVTGNPVPNYRCASTDGTSPPTTVDATLVSGTIYQATVSGLTPATDYFFTSIATNANGTQTSQPSNPFQCGQSNSPSGPPTAPVLNGTATPTSIPVSVDITGITGTPAVSYKLYYGTANVGTLFGDMTISGNSATATVTGLQPSTNYYFKAVATNGVPTDKASAISAPISTSGATPVAPSGNAAQFTPTIASGPTDTTINLNVNSSSITGIPAPALAVLVSLLPDPTTDPNAIKFGFSTSPIAITNLNPNTPYYFVAKADNNNAPPFYSNVLSSKTLPPGGNVPPSGPPTVPIVSTAQAPTDSTITVTIDTTGITGSPSVAYSIGFSDTSGGTYTFIPATFVGATIFTATAAGLTPSTPYFFKSKASNGVAPDQISAVSAPISTIATPTNAIINQLLVTFLIKGTDGTWQINTSGNAGYGTFFLTGTNAGKIISGAGSGLPNQADSITYLLNAKLIPDTKLLVSMGGATGNLSQMMPTAQAARDLVNTIWNSLFGAASPNTLNWSNAAWGGGPTPLFFDGLDLDWENGIDGAISYAFVDQWAQNVTTYGGTVGKKYLNMAPQSPNTWVNPGFNNSSSPWTNNLLNIPFTSSTAALSTIATGFLTSQALAAPEQLKHFDVVFIQCYNQVNQYLTSPPGSTTYNPVFTTQLAQWAYLVMKARRAGGNTVLCWGFASTDALDGTVWVNGGNKDGNILNQAITLINPFVSAQLVADGGAACSAAEWSQAFGMWNSPSNIAPIKFLFGPTSDTRKTNVKGTYTVLYASASFPAPNPTWTATNLPVIDTRYE